MVSYVVFSLILSCGVKVVSPCYRRWRNNLNERMSLSIPFPFWVAAEQKGGQG